MPSRHMLLQREFGLYLLLVSLSVFFAASMVMVLLLWPAPGTGRLYLPPVLWASTTALLISSLSLRQSLKSVRREKVAIFRGWLLTALIAGCLFCILQTAGLAQLLSMHLQQHLQTRAWGKLFVLVLLHALHYLGGMVVLGLAVRQAWKGRFDHEYHPTIKACVIYWTFLDVVWFVMLIVFLITL